MNKEVTLWYRIGEKGEPEYNHLEDGHSPNPTPTPLFDEQKKSWKNGEWKKEHAQLTDTIPPRIVK